MSDGMWLMLFWVALALAVVLFTLGARNWSKARHLNGTIDGEGSLDEAGRPGTGLSQSESSQR